MSEGRTGRANGDYDRPGQKWLCAHLAAGRPCPVGPDRRGRCTAGLQSNCTPRRDGDRWLCTRPGPYGGPCADGPLPDGRCCNPQPTHKPCRPRRSLRARRGRLGVAISVLALGLALLLLDGRYHLNWIAPGELSSPHTAISERTAEQCGACHSAPGDTAHGWLRLSFAAPARADSERCLECHFGGLDSAQAHADHSVPAEALGTIEAGAPDSTQRLAALWGPPERSTAGLACGRCHQEHRGRDADITALDEVRCQSCHDARFAAFSVDHPPLEAPLKSPSLAFDHVQHRAFWSDEKLMCADCHALAADGVRMLTAGYRTGCADCHSQGQEDFHGYAIKRRPHVVLQPPDMELSADTPWPVASGVLVSPLMWLLLGGDDQALPALEDLFEADDLGLESEPFEWYPDDDGLKDEFARAFYRLLEELAGGNGAALAARLDAMTAGGAPAAALVEQLLAGQFALQAFRARWYRGQAPDPGWDPSRDATGWLIDEDEVAVHYRPSGHADPLLRAWIELIQPAELGPEHGFRGRLRIALADQLSAPGGWLYESCTVCHRQASDAGTAMRWTQVPGRAADSGYAKFTHGSHFDIRRGDESCSSCHMLGEEGGSSRGFAPYERDRCAMCHRGSLAPDDCLHCHNYHFTRP